jgi:hypothetical protein
MHPPYRHRVGLPPRLDPLCAYLQFYVWIRPGFTRPPSAQSPFAQQERYSCRGNLTGRLRERYLSIIAPTGSCARPCLSPRSSGLPIGRGVFADCYQSLLRQGPSRHYPCTPLRRRLDPYPTVLLRCSHPVLPQGLRPRIAGTTLGGQNYPCNATSTGSRHFGAAVIRFASSSYAR